MIFIFLIFAVFVAVYWTRSSRMSPAAYPSLSSDQVYAWQQLRLNNCRRFAGLFMLYVVLLVLVSFAYSYSQRHQLDWLAQLAVGVEIFYFILATVLVVQALIRTKRAKRQLGVVGNDG